MKSRFSANAPIDSVESLSILLAQVGALRVIEDTRNTTSTFQTQSECLNGELSRLQSQLSTACHDRQTKEYELRALPGQIIKKEEELATKQQKLKKLQKLDHLSHLLEDYDKSASEITLFKEICRSQDHKAFDSLLPKIQDINCHDHQGKTPLMYALQSGFLYAIDKILERGVDLHTKNSDGNNAFHMAITLKRDQIIEKFVKHDESIAHDKDAQGRPPLYLALEQDNKPIIKLLFSESDACDSLICAAIQNNLQVAKALLPMQAGLANCNDEKGRTVLSIALELSSQKVSNLLLAYGASLVCALDSNKSVKHIDLSGGGIQPNQVGAIAYELKHNNLITYLNLSNTQLTEVSCNVISDAFKINRSLIHIDLSNNNIGYKGAKFLSDALKLNKYISTINLSNDNMDEAGAIFIAELLGANNSIVRINLASNHMGDVGAIFISNKLATNNCLAYIDLTQNGIRDVGAEALADLLGSNVAVTSIKLGSNNIGHKGITHLTESMQSNTAVITELGVDDFHKTISERIAHNKVLFEQHLQGLEAKDLSSFDRSNLFKELFITFKQVQGQDWVNPIQRSSEFEQYRHHVLNIKSVLADLQSQPLDDLGNESLYASLLHGQLTHIHDGLYN